jgi:hypothetical protein
MKPIEEFYHLAKEAELKSRSEDWRGDPDLEPFCLRIVELARAYPELRLEIGDGFKKVVRDRALGDWEIILLCMHILRWPEIKDWAECRRRECIASSDWRGEPVYRRILEAFEDGWGRDEIYACLPKRA